MTYIIVKGSLHKEPPKDWQRRKDYLHKHRIELGEKIKEGIMSKSEMNKGEEGQPNFDIKVQRYDQWKKEKEPLMKEWSSINKEFKQHGEEGRPHSVDDIREGKLKFD